MTKVKTLLTLERAARKAGGDRYIGFFSSNDNEGVKLYFPQSITRPEGVPVKNITMTLEVGKEDTNSG